MAEKLLYCKLHMYQDWVHEGNTKLSIKETDCTQLFRKGSATMTTKTRTTKNSDVCSIYNIIFNILVIVVEVMINEAHLPFINS